jgi:uncharacterized membrane protein YgcG
MAALGHNGIGGTYSDRYAGAVTTIPRRFAGAAVALFLLTAGSVAIAGPAAAASSTAARSGVHAGVDDFTFSNFTADYYLDRDASGHSTLKTVEKLTAVFPSSDQNKGIVRKIPDDYLGSSLHTTFVSVSDTNGITKAYSVSDDGEYTTVETGTNDYVHGHVTYTITYTQTGVAGYFKNTNDDEFYWDTNGTQWSQPFSHVEARVHIPANLALALSGHNACYQGAQGSTAKCDISMDAVPAPTPTSDATPGPASPTTKTANSVSFSASAENLQAGENMTVAIGFAAGTFADAPSGSGSNSGGAKLPPDTVWGEVVGAIFLLIALGAIPFALIRRLVSRERDAKGRGTIIPQYDVPTGLNLMEAGSIVRRDTPAVPAQIVSFAVRGNLRILDYATTDSDADYTLELTTADGLDPEETQLITAFFPDLKPGSTFEIVAAAVDTDRIDEIRGSVDGGIIQKGWRVKAPASGGVFTGLALIALLIAEIVVIIITDAASGFADVSVPFTVIAAIVAFATGYRGFILTPAGADQRDYLLGMKLYLTVADEQRLRMLQSPTGAERVDYSDEHQVVKLYEKLLPFAVLFGVEDQWSIDLAVHYKDVNVTPTWYVSNGLFNYGVFSATLAGLSGAVTSSTTPVATSGGGSGFGGSFGGGFSGGGGGGGGGGGR